MKKLQLKAEIARRAHYIETQEGGTVMVLISMEQIEEAVKVWDQARRERSKMFKRQALAQKFR